MNSLEYYENLLNKVFPFICWVLIYDNVLNKTNFYITQSSRYFCHYNNKTQMLGVNYWNLSTLSEILNNILNTLIIVYNRKNTI